MLDLACNSINIIDRDNLHLERIKKLLYNQINCICMDAKVATVKLVTGGLLLNVTLTGDQSTANVVVSKTMYNYSMFVDSVSKGCDIRIFGGLITHMKEDEPAVEAYEITTI